MEVRVYEGLESLENLVPQWNQLLDQIPTATIFSTWEWLAPWWRAFGAGQQLLALAVLDSQQALAGLALLSRGSTRLRTLRLAGDGSGDSDNLDLLARPGCEEEFTQHFLGYLAGQNKWDVCQLNTLPGHSPVAACLLRHLEDRKWTYFTASRPWSVISLPETWDEYLKGLSSKERKKVGLFTRRLEKQHRVHYVKCSERDLAPSLESLFRLHQARWELSGEPGSFSSAERRKFYEDISRLFLEQRWLEFWLLELDGKPVAAQFGFRYRDTVFSLQEGFDPAYSSDSVGYVLRAQALKQLIGEGVRRYDFLAGESPVKARWGATVDRYLDIHFAKPSSRGALYLRSQRSFTNGKEWLRARAPRGAWQVLHKLNIRLRGLPGKKSGDESSD